MKKILMIAAVASMATPAFASKARVNALGNSAHLIDVQTAFINPAHTLLMADFATFEAGPTSVSYALPSATNTTGTYPSSSAGAEGGFSRSAGDAKYMFYLGRHSDFTNAVRGSYGFLGQENPIEIQYAKKGDISWGAAFSYSNSDVKSTTPKRKQSAMGIRLGAMTDVWEAYASIGLGAKATGGNAATAAAISSAAGALTADADATLTGTTSLQLGGEYKMDSLLYYANISMDGAKYESALAAAGNAAMNGDTTSVQVINVGLVDHNKIDGGQWFYGVSYRTSELKRTGGSIQTADLKKSDTTLPFLLGLEYDAASWATLRASVTQNVLIGSTKSEQGTTAGETDTVPNNTAVAVGAGIKFNKWVLDGSLSAGGTGDLNTTSLMSNVALTYNF